MTHPFLSDEWMAAAHEIREKYADQVPPVTTVIKINQVIVDVPFGDGEVKSYLDTSSGHLVMELGELDDHWLAGRGKPVDHETVVDPLDRDAWRSEARLVVQDPVDAQVLYGGSYHYYYGGVYKTTNGGASFTRLTGGFPAAGFYRISMAISKGDPSAASLAAPQATLTVSLTDNRTQSLAIGARTGAGQYPCALEGAATAFLVPEWRVQAILLPREKLAPRDR